MRRFRARQGRPCRTDVPRAMKAGLAGAVSRLPESVGSSPQREADGSSGRCWICLEATAPLRMAALRIALSLTSLAALSERLKLSLVRPELPPRMPMQRRWPRPRTGGSASRAKRARGPLPCSHHEPGKWVVCPAVCGNQVRRVGHHAGGRPNLSAGSRLATSRCAWPVSRGPACPGGRYRSSVGPPCSLRRSATQRTILRAVGAVRGGLAPWRSAGTRRLPGPRPQPRRAHADGRRARSMRSPRTAAAGRGSLVTAFHATPK